MPSNLHLLPDWEGGIRRWVQLFARHDSRATNLAFTARGTRTAYGLEFALVDASTWRTIERCDLEMPISELAIDRPDYRRALADLVERHGVEHIYCSSLIGQALDAIDLDCPTTLVAHDYFPFCVGLNMYFDQPCHSCDAERLRDCLRDNPHAYPFRHNSARHWWAVRERYFELLARRRPPLVVPLAGSADALRRVDSRFAAADFRIVEHGLDIAPTDCFGGADADRALRLVILGRINVPKGVRSLRRLLPRLARFAEVTLLGGGEPAEEFRAVPGVRLVRDYEPPELGGWLERLRPDAALFLSEVPETFSFTLSEARLAAIPAVARRLGALAERIEPGQTGLLFEDDDECVARLAALDADREPLRVMARTLRSIPHRTAAQMVDAYYALRAGSATGDPSPR